MGVLSAMLTRGLNFVYKTIKLSKATLIYYQDGPNYSFYIEFP